MGAWDDVLRPFVVISDPELTTLLASLPLIIILMLLQRQIVRGVATTGLGGR